MMRFRRPSSRSVQSKEESKGSSRIDTSVTYSQSSRNSQPQHPLSPRSAAEEDPYRNFRNPGHRNPFDESPGRIGTIPEIAYRTPDGRYRSQSAQRAVQSSSSFRDGGDARAYYGRRDDDGPAGYGRSRSQGRAGRSQSRGRGTTTPTTEVAYDFSRQRYASASRPVAAPVTSVRPGSETFRTSEPSVSVDSSEDEHKKRKSKMEKIRQLQAKNELYKEEFKKVQKDRKKLKKDLEAKNQEIESLTGEIDRHITETSRLKSQLSEVMIYVDRKLEEDGQDKHALKSLQKELDAIKEEHRIALRRVSELKENLNDMKEYVRRKDAQLETLTIEVADQQRQIERLEGEKKELFVNKDDQDKVESMRVTDLCRQNDTLRSELAATVERATGMVKEREEAIADLLKENDDLKKQIKIARNQMLSDHVSQEEIDHLREDLQRVQASLEEAQDRNVMLEEEIEQWINRGSEMEGMVERLDKDVATWKGKEADARQSVERLESQLIDAKSEAATHKNALQQAHAKFESDVVALKEKHNAAIADIEARAFAERVEKPGPSEQAMLLELAVARQKDPTKQVGGASWRKFLAGSVSEDASEVGEKEKRFKELQEENQAQSDEIKALKSELVKLRSTYNDAMYMHKKKIEALEDDNKRHVQKISSLEEQLRMGSAFENYLKERQASIEKAAVSS